MKIELPKGRYDIRVVDEDGDSYIKGNVDLNSDYTWVVTIGDLGTSSGKLVAGERSKPVNKSQIEDIVINNLKTNLERTTP